MKKLFVLVLTATLVASPMACVNDPTDSNAVCPEGATDASQCTEVSSDTVVEAGTDVVDPTDTVVDTATATE